VATLPAGSAAALPAGACEEAVGRRWLCLKLVDGSGHAGAPVFANYERRGNELRLVPRYALAAGALYRAELLLSDGTLQTAEYRVPAAEQQAPEVVAVFPTAERLPANLLKFYIHFSQTMREGREIFEQVSLVDDRGVAVAEPWRPTELWTADARRLTLWIHPGRVKRGVNLREEIGPVLEPNREYTLVISNRMLSAAGQPLKRNYEKRFRVAEEDHRRPLPAEWTLRVPRAESTEPLLVEFPEPLDRYLMERYLQLVDDQGRPVMGQAVIGRDERSWLFQPETLWRAANYRLVVDENLEDLAGNTPARVFDTDLSEDSPSIPVLRRGFRPMVDPVNGKPGD
jgi:hypothetical protein